MFLKQRQALLGLWLFSVCSFADQRPDSHGPIGVMGEHTHAAGEVMLSYRYGFMQMQDNRDGTDELSVSEVLINGTGDYRVVPTEMTMRMHMLGAMYAPTDQVTLMLMVPWVESEMDHVTAMGGSFTTKSDDLGDVSFSAIVDWRGGYWSLGLSLPTGTQDEEDLTPMGVSTLPYPMQIGSGTYDLIARVGGTRYMDEYSLGGQAEAVIRTGENDDDYRLGNRLKLTGWYARQLSHSVSVSARLMYQYDDSIHGEDPRYANALAINLVQTVDPDLSGGSQLDIALGLNWTAHGHRIGAEISKPVWQDLNGPQLEDDWRMTLGYQYAF